MIKLAFVLGLTIGVSISAGLKFGLFALAAGAIVYAYVHCKKRITRRRMRVQ